MLFFIYFFFSISLQKSSNRHNKHFITCNHDREYLSQLRIIKPHKLIKPNDEEPKEDYNAEVIKNEIANRKGIRVKMALNAIEDPNIDKEACKKVGDTYNDGRKTITCRKEDLLEEWSQKVIIETMKNAEKYIQKLVNVTQVDSPNDLKETGIKWTKIPESIEDNDLFIFVLPRPYGETSSTLASATAIKYMPSEDNQKTDFNESEPLNARRPRIGKININVAKLPAKPQDYNSGDRQFFITCMHELMHVLAFARGLFPYWINRTSGRKYDNSRFNYKFKNNYDIEQSFISSPKLTEWVNDRFQVVDPELNHLGLELEDGGGDGTAGSHPNSRLYFTDIMQGKTYGPGYFSPIFFHSLYDSGWYEPNYELAEQLVYLDPRYVNEPISQYVLTEPPRESFPKELFCNNNYQAYCYYDYSYKAVCDTLSYKDTMESTNADIKKYRDYKNFTTWYGGPDNKYSDEENFDFMPVLFPSGDSNCRNEFAPEESEDVAKMAQRMEETYSNSSVCLLTTIWKQSLTQFSLQKNAGCYKARCGEDNKLRITLPKTPEQVCLRENQRIYKKGSTKYALCPRVEAACANLPQKTTMVAVLSALPDRGPYNGQNFVLLQGLNLKSHNITKVIFASIPNKQPKNLGDNEYTKIVEFDQESFIEYTNDRILLQMPSLKVDKKYIGVPIDLVFQTKDEINVNFVEEIYTFLKRDYSNPK